MPGPPPPPPPGGPPPLAMPSAFPLSGGKNSQDNRGALLQSIRKGTKLKKTVTVDKSAPLIAANMSKNSNNNDSGSTASLRSGNAGVSSSGPQNGIVLGGLFASGMPKLKATGRLGIISNSGSDSNISSNNMQRNFDVSNQAQKNVNSIQSELKKQMASDSKNRGPPPPAPIRSFAVSDESSHSNKNGSTLHHNSSVPQIYPNSQFKTNSSTLHKKANSNVNISTSFDSVDATQNNNNFPSKPNHGKPNLAPKPPALNGKPTAPPKKLIINKSSISRAHSMKSPRISSPESPENKNNLSYASNIGTVRNLSSVISNSLAQSTGNLTQRPRLPLNGRPSAPPPSIPLQQTPPPPPSKMIKPVHAPPPPPQHAPPPPPSRMAPTQPSRPPPAVPSAPPPPPRHSSIRDATLKKNISLDLETKFANMFHGVQEFPRPMMYKNVTKIYNSKQVVNKQQAPLPPNHVQNNNNRMWNATSS